MSVFAVRDIGTAIQTLFETHRTRTGIICIVYPSAILFVTFVADTSSVMTMSPVLWSGKMKIERRRMQVR